MHRDRSVQRFKLSPTFLDEYRDREPDWGPLGEFVYLRTYSRKIEEENRNETWPETVQRVVEGVFQLQKEHCHNLNLPWDNAKSQRSAQKMFDKIFNFKFLPPGRGLWMMGTDFVRERTGAGLFNCAFVSTEDIQTKGSVPFTWTNDALMLGVGVGFDTKGADKLTVKRPKDTDGEFIIPDSREGWVESVGIVLDAFFYGKPLPSFDYSIIRKEGTPLKGFGGVASGPGPLMDLHRNVIKLLTSRIDKKLRSTDIVDIMNLIGVCVVAGNVRRSAEIAVGEADDSEYVTMKDYNLHPDEVINHRWSSNNSVFAKVGETDYFAIADSIKLNGEPGIVWLDNIQKYGRTTDQPDWADRMAAGVNPCFTGDTLVHTSEGAFPIRYLAELVSAKGHDFTVDTRVEFTGFSRWQSQKYKHILTKWFKHKTYEERLKKARAFSTGVKEIVEVVLSDDTSFRCTPDHKIASVSIDKWIEAKDSVGEQLYSDNSEDKAVFVKDVIWTGESEEVFDLSVDDNHNFFIELPKNNSGYSRILVHNCGEQTLESMELCCLVESFPALHDSYEEYKETLKYAYLYGKSVTLASTHWPETNAVMMKNRRIGTSQSGIIDAFVKHGRREILRWSDEGYKYLKTLDETYSNWLCIPKSKKITSVKPSGTTSLLPGASPGIHYPHSEYYYRTIRIASDSPFVPIFERAGYRVEDSVTGTEETKKKTKVLYFAVHEENFVQKKDDVSIWEQVKNAVDYQRYWADNNVSITVTFKQDEADQIPYVLQAFEDELKAISFLPISEHGYAQAPYQEITREEYEGYTSSLGELDFSTIVTTPEGEKYCDGDHCVVPGSDEPEQTTITVGVLGD